MKLFYTGAATFDAEQKEKDKSLGGFKASTLIPNDLLGNLFGDLSMYTLDEKLRETRAIIFLNDSGATLDDLFIHFDKATGALGTYEVAAVAIAPNAAGTNYEISIPATAGADCGSGANVIDVQRMWTTANTLLAADVNVTTQFWCTGLTSGATVNVGHNTAVNIATATDILITAVAIPT